MTAEGLPSHMHLCKGGLLSCLRIPWNIFYLSPVTSYLQLLARFLFISGACARITPFVCDDTVPVNGTASSTL